MKKQLSYLQIIALGFLTIIAVGTALLMLPVSSAAPGGAPFHVRTARTAMIL